MLGVLADHHLNMLKLESRPIPGQLFEYCFYVDFTGHLHDENVRTAMTEIRRRCSECRVLGCYRSAASVQE